MTDPEFADRTYIEPITAGNRREDHRDARSPTRSCPRSAARPPSTPRWTLHEQGILDEVRRRDDRRQRRRDRQGRGPPALQGGDDQDRPGCAALRRRAHNLTRRARSPTRSAFPLIIRPAFTLGGTGGGIAYNREEFEEIVQRGLDLSPGQRGADRGIAPRLEGIRDGGHARPRGQLRDHLLHRKFRPDGRPHRRFDHRRPRPDADRQGIPAHARRLLRGHPRDRRRDRRLEHPVRRRSRRPAGWSSSR